MRKTYSTDLSDEEWTYIEPHLPVPGAPGRPRLHSLREVLDAIFYIVRSGCARRLLPHDFPPWKTIHHYFRTWRIDGTWERMHAVLRKRSRVRMKRDLEPGAGVVDSQSVKTTGVGGEKSVATTEERRSKEGSAIFWWARRVWWSKRGSTARTSKTVKASRSCWSRRRVASRGVSLTCGWTPATQAKIREQAGWKGRWAGRQRSCVTHLGRPLRR